MKDAEHPFFRPLWRRIALVAFCAVWTAIEVWNNSGLWVWLTAGLTAYAAWLFLLNYKGPVETPPAEKE